MVVADDPFRPVAEFTHHVELDFGVDQEAFAAVAVGDVGAGLDAGDQDIAPRVFAPAGEQPAAFHRIGVLGLIGDGL